MHGSAFRGSEGSATVKVNLQELSYSQEMAKLLGKHDGSLRQSSDTAFDGKTNESVQQVHTHKFSVQKQTTKRVSSPYNLDLPVDVGVQTGSKVLIEDNVMSKADVNTEKMDDYTPVISPIHEMEQKETAKPNLREMQGETKFSAEGKVMTESADDFDYKATYYPSTTDDFNRTITIQDYQLA